MPARTCWQWRAATRAPRPAMALAIAAVCGAWSSHAASSTATADSMETSVSARRWRTAWNRAIGRPNWMRSSACSRASCSMRLDAPTSSCPSASCPSATAACQSTGPSSLAPSTPPASSTRPSEGSIPSTVRSASDAVPTSTATCASPARPTISAVSRSRRLAVPIPRTSSRPPFTAPGGLHRPSAGSATAAASYPRAWASTRSSAEDVAFAAPCSSNSTDTAVRVSTDSASRHPSSSCAASSAAPLWLSVAWRRLRSNSSRSSPSIMGVPRLGRRPRPLIASGEGRVGSGWRRGCGPLPAPLGAGGGRAAPQATGPVSGGERTGAAGSLVAPQLEQAAGDDVGLDLGGAAVDRCGAGVEDPAPPALALGVVADRDRGGQSVRGEVEHSLLGGREEHLADRGLRSQPGSRRHPVLRSPRPRAECVDELGDLAERERVEGARLRGVDDVPQPAVQPGRPLPEGRAPLVGEEIHGDRPTLALFTDGAVEGDEHVVVEDLRELLLAVHGLDGPDRDAGRVHVDEEGGDAPVGRFEGAGPGQQDAPLGVLGQAGPHLLAGHPPAVVGADGAAGERREVAAGARLGEALAPDLVAAQQRRQHRRGQLGPGERDHRKPEHLGHRVEAGFHQVPRRDRLAQVGAQERRPTEPADVLRPAPAGPAGVEREAPHLGDLGHLLVERASAVEGGGELVGVLVEPVIQRLAEGVELHGSGHRCYPAGWAVGSGRRGSCALPESAPPWRRRNVIDRVSRRQPFSVRT